MKLNVNLSLLLSAVEKMGAAGIDVTFRPVTLDDLDLQLGGYDFEISFDEIDFENGLASYQGRQVILYIKDHVFNILQALENPQKAGRKFHIADCETLKEMRRKGRFDRYIVTNSLSGKFEIAGAVAGVGYKGTVELSVCKNCLKYLNYKGYKTGGVKLQIFNGFKIADFFDAYSSFFPHMPSGIANIRSADYTSDWNNISTNYKKKQNHICESCGVNMSGAKHLYHVHHRNGVKGDNIQSNLMALCADCHKKQPNHEHLFILRKDATEINRLRKVQRIIVIHSWEDVNKYVDPALHGLVRLLKSENVALPLVGEVLFADVPELMADLVWRKQKMAITIDHFFTKKAKSFGWTIYSMAECLNESLNENFHCITSKLK